MMSLSYLRWQILSGSRLCNQKHFLIQNLCFKAYFQKDCFFFYIKYSQKYFLFSHFQKCSKKANIFLEHKFREKVVKTYEISDFRKNGKWHFRFSPTGFILQGSNYENPKLMRNSFSFLMYLDSLHELLQLTAASSGCLRHFLLYLPTKHGFSVIYKKNF